MVQIEVQLGCLQKSITRKFRAQMVSCSALPRVKKCARKSCQSLSCTAANAPCRQFPLIDLEQMWAVIDFYSDPSCTFSTLTMQFHFTHMLLDCNDEAIPRS